MGQGHQGSQYQAAIVTTKARNGIGIGVELEVAWRIWTRHQVEFLPECGEDAADQERR